MICLIIIACLVIIVVVQQAYIYGLEKSLKAHMDARMKVTEDLCNAINTIRKMKGTK